jgi:hypothetical protein
VIKARPTPWRAPIVMSVVEDDPADRARAAAQWARAERNSDWLEAHAGEIYSRHRDRFICIAGQELFVAETPEAALSAARAKHPDDDGRIVRYIPAAKLARI